MQNRITKEDAVRLGSGTLSISVDNGQNWINLGALNTPVFAYEKSITTLVFSNAKGTPKEKVVNVALSADLAEIDLDNLQKINGIADYSTIDGTPVNELNEALGTGWTIDTAIKLANKNGDNTEVTSITVKADAVALVLDTDYRVITKGDGYTYILPLTAQAGVLTADYTYTPLASVKQVFKDVVKNTATAQYKFENVQGGKTFRITFFKGYNTEGMNIGFQDDDSTDTAVLPISITALPVDDTNELFEIYDEQSVT